MIAENTLLEIMEKTILSLKTNKDSLMDIIQNLRSEYEKKKLELNEIKLKLPQLMVESKRLTVLDRQLRNELARASHDFSAAGHQRMQELFKEANETHVAMLKAEEFEHSYNKRRNELELDLRKSEVNIEKAETMANQLINSLAYLYTGIEEINNKSSHAEVSDQLSFFKCIENEKARIARDLHDGPMQRIASVQMRIDFCKTAVGLDLVKGLELLETLKKDLALTISDVREILFDLNPAPLSKIGLKASVEHMIYNILDKQEVKIDFLYNLDDTALDSSIQNTIYRLIQELLNNIKKHAKASYIKLKVFSANHFIAIILEDNGVGFSVPNDFEILRTENKSYGLFNIHTRIKQLDGHLKITSTPNVGTTFKIELPI